MNFEWSQRIFRGTCKLISLSNEHFAPKLAFALWIKHKQMASKCQWRTDGCKLAATISGGIERTHMVCVRNAIQIFEVIDENQYKMFSFPRFCNGRWKMNENHGKFGLLILKFLFLFYSFRKNHRTLSCDWIVRDRSVPLLRRPHRFHFNVQLVWLKTIWKCEIEIVIQLANVCKGNAWGRLRHRQHSWTNAHISFIC